MSRKTYVINFISGPGCGKCLGKDTTVIMYDGKLKKVQDIVVGDLLMGDDSKPRKVLNLARGKEKLYEIEQLKADNYIVNESHILSLALSKKGSIYWYEKNNSYYVEWYIKDGYRTKKFEVKKYDNNKEKTYIEADKFLKNIKNTLSYSIDIPLKEYIQKSNKWKMAFKGYKVGVEFQKKDVLIQEVLK